MNNNKINRIFSIVVLVIAIITMLLAIFYNTAFVPTCMLMLALYLFSECYLIREDKSKTLDRVYYRMEKGVYTFLRLI